MDVIPRVEPENLGPESAVKQLFWEGFGNFEANCYCALLSQ